jgi:hypothetical protein
MHMSYSWSTPVRRRNRLIGLLAVVAVGVATLLAAPIAEADKPVVTPAAVITIDRVSTPSISVPDSAGSAGLAYVVKNTAFDVHFTTSIPLSTSKSTTVLLTVITNSDTDTDTLSLEYDVPAGQNWGLFTSAVLPTAASGVTLKVAVDARKTDVTPGTRSVDVLKTSVPAPQTSNLTGIGGGGDIGAACDPIPADPVCGDLVLPTTNTVDTPLLLGQGCGDTASLASYLQVLFGVSANASKTDPFTFIAKCDKSLCTGKGIKSYKLMVSLDAGDVPTVSPACTVKGVVNSDPKVDFCTDYVQSTRDGAGDVLLYLLFIRDARIIFG